MDSIDLLRSFGVATSRGTRAYSAEEAVSVANTMSRGMQPACLSRRHARLIFGWGASCDFGGGGSKGTSKVVIKAQVLAGGRGKGRFDNGFQGGVHVVSRTYGRNVCAPSSSASSLTH